jgi:putative transposase
VEHKEIIAEICEEAKKNKVRQKIICYGIGIEARTLQKWKKEGYADRRKGAPKQVHNKLTESEEHRILYKACSMKYKDKTPGEMVADLAERGEYIGSVKSIYRVFKRTNLILLNRRQRRKSKAVLAEIKATRSNEQWSWDISYLKTAVKGKYFYLYLITDIWDRYIIGWEIHEEESGELARQLFEKISGRLNVSGIKLHSDNGGPMKSTTFRAVLEKLEVLQTFSRPSVSNDNAFSESLFSTLKRNAGYPKKFYTIEEAREWMARFVNWYNNEHMHSGLCYVTPAQRRKGEDREIFEKRNKTFDLARLAHPERWTGKTKVWEIEQEVFLKRGNQIKKVC